jgi:hypothetical protein
MRAPRAQRIGAWIPAAGLGCEPAREHPLSGQAKLTARGEQKQALNFIQKHQGICIVAVDLQPPFDRMQV